MSFNTHSARRCVLRLMRAQVCSWQILLQKSPVTDDVDLAISLGAAGFGPRPRRSLRNSYATQYTEPERVAVAQPAMRAAAGSEQWRPERTHPGRLVGHEVEADRAAGCASDVRTASRSSSAHVATAQSPRCQRTIARRRARAHGYRAGSCVMALLGSTGV